MRPSNDFELTCHENFEGHQEAMGRAVITCAEAQEMWDAGFEFRGNRTGFPSEWLIIGYAGRRLITVAVLWRPHPQDFRAMNAWDTKVSDW